MKIIFLIGCILTSGLFQTIFGQDVPVTPAPERNYLIGVGDEIAGRVFGEPQFDFTATIDEDGKFQIPFFDKPIQAKCRTENELRAEVTRLLSKYLKYPQISVRVTGRKSRPPAIVTGEVRAPQQVELRREARLFELISFAGGANTEANGMVQVFRTQSPMCADEDKSSDWTAESDNGSVVPSRIYSLSNLRAGKDEANPVIYPGDVIIVQRASPVYITGEVAAPQGILLKENGTTLMEALAKIGGVNRQAKTKDIKIYRLKANSKDREIIAVNYDRIKKGEQKDVLLEPYDIVEVDKSKKSITQLVLETALGVGRTAIQTVGTGLPTRVLY